MNQEYNPKIHRILPDKVELVLSFFCVLLCSVSVPFLLMIPLTEGPLWALSAGILAVVIFALRRLAGSLRTILSFLLFLGGSLLLSGSLLLAALLAALFGSVVLFAYLVTVRPHPALILLPALSYALTLAILGDPLASTVALLPYPTALLLVWGFRARVGRAAMICRATVGLGATLLVAAAAYFVLHFGIPSFALLEELADTAANTLIRTLTDTLLSLYETMEMTVNSADLLSLSTLLVTTLFNFLPAAFLLLCGTVAFFAHLLYAALLANSSKREDPEFSLSVLSAMRFEMSTVSAVVFLLGFLFSLLSGSGEYALYGLAAKNLLLILMPGLAFTTHLGIRKLMLKKGPSCLSSLLYFSYLASFLYLPTLVLALSSLVGAVLVLIRTVRSARQNKIKE